MTVLVVAAHPDDETLGAGASAARWTSDGRDVHWLILGEGSTSREGVSPQDAAEQRAASRAAAAELGVATVRQELFPDSRFDAVDLVDLVGVVDDAISTVRPTLVITHDRSDVNQDHRRVGDAVLVATRPVPGHPVEDLWTMETPSSTEWGFGYHGHFEPSCFVDVSGTIERKRAALAHYDSEVRQPPHPRSLTALDALATWRGAAVGVTSAEAFRVVRQIR